MQTSFRAAVRPLQPLAPKGPAPQDIQLPAMPEALDPATMLAVFRRLGQALASTLRVEVSYVRYKPAQSLIVQYRLSGPAGARIFHGRMGAVSRYEPLLKKAMARHLAEPGGEPVVYGLKSLNMVLVAFPHDRAVSGLRQILDPHKLKRIVHQRVKRFAPQRYWVMGRKSRIELISYKPERRCLVRCHLKVHDRLTRATLEETVYARIYKDSTGRKISRLLQDLSGQAEVAGCFPRPMGYDPDWQILFCEAVPGSPALGEEVKPLPLQDAEAAGRLLGCLHRQEVEISRFLEAGRLQDQALEMASRLVAAGAPASDLLLAAACGLKRSGSGSRQAPVCLHGDYHPGQILREGNSFRCVDFDEAGMGEPGFDLGYYLAHLKRLVWLGRLEESDLEAAANRFLAGYQEATGRVVLPEEWRFHRNLTLLRMALNGVKHLEENWPESARFYLQEVGLG